MYIQTVLSRSKCIKDIILNMDKINSKGCAIKDKIANLSFVTKFRLTSKRA